MMSSSVPFSSLSNLMLASIQSILAHSYKGLVNFTLAAAVLCGMPASATTVAEPKQQTSVLDTVVKSCLYRYNTATSTKAVNLRMVTEISMDKVGNINVQTFNGSRDIVIVTPTQQDRLAYLAVVLAQWERCIATR